MSLVAHLAVLGLLLVDLSLGGHVVRTFAGRYPTMAFEFAIILGYVLCVLQWLPWRRDDGS
jgi:hypothetical protein